MNTEKSNQSSSEKSNPSNFQSMSQRKSADMLKREDQKRPINSRPNVSANREQEQGSIRRATEQQKWQETPHRKRRFIPYDQNDDSFDDLNEIGNGLYDLEDEEDSLKRKNNNLGIEE